MAWKKPRVTPIAIHTPVATKAGIPMKARPRKPAAVVAEVQTHAGPMRKSAARTPSR